MPYCEVDENFRKMKKYSTVPAILLGFIIWDTNSFALQENISIMENINKFIVLDAIENVYKQAENSQLKLQILKTFDDLPFLMDFFSLNEIQTVLYCVIFVGNYNDERFSSSWEYLKLTKIDSLRYKNDAQILLRKRLIVYNGHSIRRGNEYDINEKFIQNIIDNKKIENDYQTELTLIQVINVFENIKETYEDLLYQRDFHQELMDFFNNYHFSVFKYLQNMKLETYQIYFIFTAIVDALENANNDYNTNILFTLKLFFQGKTKSFFQYRKIIKNEDKLTSKNLIDIEENNFRGFCDCKLSDKIVELLKEDGIELDNITQKNRENSKLIYHKKLPLKTLFYNDAEKKEIEILNNALKDEQFNLLQKRLEEKAMPVGITALFYGSPGTGKTESVYQLAKQSGRNIYKVNISEIKSKWFGDSQKLTKEIFTIYAQLKKEEEKCPILLFNEADGIIGKRKPAGSSAVSDTENAIQNIFLEEIEKFDGILMATTNLIDNIDSAFERRFLYKIRFEKPIIENVLKIWQNKFPFLSENEAEKLAKKFDFSGGEMENIARKTLMNEVLNNIPPNYENILQLCGQERWNDERKLGF